jgi:hypothetical protein
MYSLSDPEQIEILTDYVEHLNLEQLSKVRTLIKGVKEHVEECAIDKSVMVKDILIG